MLKKSSISVVVLCLFSGCAGMNQQTPANVSNSRVVTRDLMNAQTDTSRVRVVNANLSVPKPAVVPAKVISPDAKALAKAAPVQTRFKFEPSDLSFKLALMRWAKVVGWQVSWEAEKDFPGRISAEFPNDFEQAVAEATKAYKNSDYPLKSCGYDNKVIRVVRYLGTGKECEIN